MVCFFNICSETVRRASRLSGGIHTSAFREAFNQLASGNQVLPSGDLSKSSISVSTYVQYILSSTGVVGLLSRQLQQFVKI